MKAFIKSSVFWLALGVTLGLAIAVHPAWAMYRLAHVHMNLLGFVAMMIFGVAYHVIPRFVGAPLGSVRLAGVHWWLANIGLACFAGGFILAPHGIHAGRALLVAGGVLSATGAYAFAWNVWKTLDARRPEPAASQPRRSEQPRTLPMAASTH